MRDSRSAVAVALLCAIAAAPALAQQQKSARPLDVTLIESLEWRSIGPANMAGRITDIEGIPSPSKTFYVVAAAGGIWKTTNNGTSFRPIFDPERVIAMGDLAIAPSDTLQIWAGTGEEDSRNSISPGGGIYKSTDGGESWQFMGLKETQTIGRIVVHPTNPDIVYVAALGAIWNTNPERGLYRTTDGGETWELIKHISDRAGFVDIAMHPRDPDILFAASWERIRGPYFLESGGPGSALWKSTDGGESWTAVEGGGFPETEKGRIGIAIAPSDPDVVYALVEAEAPDGEDGGCRAAKEGGCGLYRSEDGGETWTWMNGNDVRPFYYSQLRVDPKDPNRVYWSSTPVNFSDDGGKTVRNTTLGLHVDHHAMWIDPNDPQRFVVGNDGGIAITFDRGGNYLFINTMPLGQFYAVSYDMAVPYNVCGGLQDNGSWCGPSRRADGEITNYMWFKVGGGDGFYTAQDPMNPDIGYAESQGGNMSRIDLTTGERTRIEEPDWRERYTMYEDSIVLLHPDTTVEPSPEVAERIAALRQRQAADSAAMALRWNWNTPFFLSPHDPKVFYAGANRVLKSSNRGEDLRPISPDLTTRDTMRIRISTRETGGITSDVTGAETHSTIVALAESPLVQGMLFAGTDDGNVWISPDDGETWNELTGRFPGVPPKTWVSRIEPSHHDGQTFYVTFDGHRDGDFTPYVFVTTDGGETFRSIANDLPTGGPDFVHVIREDPVNRNLLFVGTDVGLYVSTDRGTSWSRFMNGLPTVPVHDLKIHPRDHELIAGTHGRSIWIVDIAPLQQLDAGILAGGPVLFEPAPAFQYGDRPIGGGSMGHQFFAADVPSYGARITYYTPAGERGDSARIAILDAAGDTIHTMSGPGAAGLHHVAWDFEGKPEPREPLSPSERRDSINTALRVAVVADSLIEAGKDREQVERVAAALTGEGPGVGALFRRGRRGRRQGGGGGFVARPGESPAPRARGGEGGEGGERGAGGTDQMRDIFSAFRDAGIGRRFRFGGGGDDTTAEPGVYTVAVTVGGETLTQTLRVERDTDLARTGVAAGGGVGGR